MKTTRDSSKFQMINSQELNLILNRTKDLLNKSKLKEI